jgi:hypothetical protein
LARLAYSKGRINSISCDEDVQSFEAAPGLPIQQTILNLTKESSG